MLWIEHKVPGMRPSRLLRFIFNLVRSGRSPISAGMFPCKSFRDRFSSSNAVKDAIWRGRVPVIKPPLICR